MTDDLRNRIAAVLCAHPDKWDGTCCGGHDFETQDEWAAHVADAVIKGLNLQPMGEELNVVARRYVTGWVYSIPMSPPVRAVGGAGD